MNASESFLISPWYWTGFLKDFSIIIEEKIKVSMNGVKHVVRNIMWCRFHLKSWGRRASLRFDTWLRVEGGRIARETSQISSHQLHLITKTSILFRNTLKWQYLHSTRLFLVTFQFISLTSTFLPPRVWAKAEITALQLSSFVTTAYETQAIMAYRIGECTANLQYMLVCLHQTELAKSGRAGCKNTYCKNNGIKIGKDELRLGTWVETERFASWTWKHW